VDDRDAGLQPPGEKSDFGLEREREREKETEKEKGEREERTNSKLTFFSLSSPNGKNPKTHTSPLSKGAWCTPLYDTLGDDAVRYVLGHAEIGLVFCDAAKLTPLAEALAAGACSDGSTAPPRVRCVVVWGGEEDGASSDEALAAAAATIAAGAAAGAVPLRILRLSEFERESLSHPSFPAPTGDARREDVCTIMYTSGTTGHPKGVMITHGGILATVAGQARSFDQLGEELGETLTSDDVMLSYLPLAHIFDRALEELFLSVGARIGYWRGRIDGVLSDIGALRPTFFIGVPRVFDRVYAGVRAQLAAASPLRRAVFSLALWHKRRGIDAGVHWDHASPLADRLVFSKVKARLGGRVRVVASGSAPLAPHVERFLKVAMCCPVVQGYGLTETCGASFCAMPVPQHTGRVGGALPCLHYKLQSVPEMGYDALAAPPRGEVLLRGPPVFKGYYKDVEKTKEVLDDDGWFHTGDIGELAEDGSLKIIDRMKSLFKLAQGEYVSPERVEGVLSACPLVAQAWVTGDSLRSSPAAVVVPDEAQLRALARALRASAGNGNGKGGDAPSDASMEVLCAHRGLRDAVARELAAHARASGLRSFEIPRAVALEHEAWDVESGLMTPTFKLKRPQLGKKYEAVVAALYKADKSFLQGL
jgi:long-chain acyl-CoA synthetase